MYVTISHLISIFDFYDDFAKQKTEKVHTDVCVRVRVRREIVDRKTNELASRRRNCARRDFDLFQRRRRRREGRGYNRSRDV